MPSGRARNCQWHTVQQGPIVTLIQSADDHETAFLDAGATDATNDFAGILIRCFPDGFCGYAVLHRRALLLHQDDRSHAFPFHISRDDHLVELLAGVLQADVKIYRRSLLNRNVTDDLRGIADIAKHDVIGTIGNVGDQVTSVQVRNSAQRRAFDHDRDTDQRFSVRFVDHDTGHTSTQTIVVAEYEQVQAECQ